VKGGIKVGLELGKFERSCKCAGVGVPDLPEPSSRGRLINDREWMGIGSCNSEDLGCRGIF
jgi:hypothetical protein